MKRPSRTPPVLRWTSVPLLIAVAIGVLGLLVIARFPIWAEIDERPHYAYVQSIAEQHRLPLIDDLVSPEVQAITAGTWPEPSPKPPGSEGLGGRSYEAFQPPLYYLLAAPAFAAVPDHRDKVFALRGFNLLLIALAGVVLAYGARALAPRGGARLALAAGLLTLAWPGVLVRGITVSNAPLELVLAPAFMLAAWLAATAASVKRLAAAAALLGLCLLTKLTLVILAPMLVVATVAVCRARTDLRTRLLSLGMLALPVAALAPWLASNHARFGEWTANRLAQRQQTPFLYPGGLPEFGLGDLLARFDLLLDGALPQEWDAQLEVWWIGIAARALILLLLALVAAGLVMAPRPVKRSVLFFAAPLLVGAAVAVWTLLAVDWDIFLLRYFQPVLPVLAVAAAAALARTRLSWLRTGVAVTAVIVAALWIDMAGAFLFTDVGDRLGI